MTSGTKMWLLPAIPGICQSSRSTAMKEGEINSSNFRGGNEFVIVLDITRCFKANRCIPLMVMLNRIDLSRNELQCNESSSSTFNHRFLIYGWSRAWNHPRH
jgi:hypothetical protein